MLNYLGQFYQTLIQLITGITIGLVSVLSVFICLSLHNGNSMRALISLLAIVAVLAVSVCSIFLVYWIYPNIAI